MKTQKLSTKNISDKKLPAQTAVIQLLDKDRNHLAYIACRHEQRFPHYDYGDDHRYSHFLEEVSNVENQMLHAFFKIDKELKKKCGGWWTGEFIITDENAEIIYHSIPC